MKYESELIKEIVDTRGHETPLLHYESECVESWIDEAKGAYPKLNDYRGEWLNYMVENPIGEFPYIALSDVTDATVDNVVPYAYKSAILKGNTIKKIGLENGSYNGYLEKIPMDNRLRTTERVNGYNIIRIECKDGYQAFIRTGSKDSSWNQSLSMTFESEQSFVVLFRKNDESVFSQSDYGNIIEYTNIAEISDNNGNELVSVKMPVLTTTGKNLFDVESSKKGFYWSSTETQYDDSEGDSYLSEKYIPINEGDVLIANNKQGSIQYMEYDSNKNFMNRSIGVANTPYTVPSGVSFLRVSFYRTGIGSNCQLEKGTKSTPFESHKSNILMVNEDVELRGIGDVKDTLDLMTGEVTQRIGEVVLDGSENWVDSDNNLTNTHRFTIIIPNFKSSGLLFNDGGFKNITSGTSTDDTKNIQMSGTSLFLRIDRSVADDVIALKDYLSKKNLTVYGELPENYIKTVDLLITNQDGNTLSKIKPIEGTMHLATSSDTLKPTFSGEIPVEATTQNLASFIEG